jgi:methylenetetrahydrofolate dehydrogenase (NADP+)/methenyltetrahydrofolate cyclohydrolase
MQAALDSVAVSVTLGNMTRKLNGSELAGFIKERQAREVRTLRMAQHIIPKLVIIQTIDSEVIDKYVSLKQAYGDHIDVEVEVYKIDQDQLPGVIERLNNDPSVHGIIIQLPLADKSKTDESVNAVANKKDVDGLGMGAEFVPATPMAIDWLLAGYNVDLKGKKIAVVGHGLLVGKPLVEMWLANGYDVTVFDEKSTDMHERLPEFDIIVSATGVPGLITSADVKPGAVVVDAGTASEQWKIVGDVTKEVRDREDVKATPEIGGVGPMTVAALFENVIKAARSTTQE